MEQNRSSKKQPRPIIYIVLSVVLLVLAVVVGVCAKYVAGFDSSPKTVATVQFCFLTNHEENDESNPYYVYGDTISFSVRNYDEYNVADSAITYSVTISTVIGGETVVYSVPTHPLTPTAEEKRQSETIGYKTSQDGNYVATVTSNTPFAKTIILYFRVSSHYADSYYKVTAHPDEGWTQLDIYTGKDNADINVYYADMQPDNTSEFMPDWLTVNHNGTMTGLEAFSHYTLIFFGEYDSAKPFVLIQGKGTAEEKVLGEGEPT